MALRYAPLLSKGGWEASAAAMYEANQLCLPSHSKRQVFQLSICILSRAPVLVAE